MVILIHSRSGGHAGIATLNLGNISSAKGHEGDVVDKMCSVHCFIQPTRRIDLMEVSRVPRPSVMSPVRRPQPCQ